LTHMLCIAYYMSELLRTWRWSNQTETCHPNIKNCCVSDRHY